MLVILFVRAMCFLHLEFTVSGFHKNEQFFLTKSPQIFDVFKIGSYMFQLSHNYVSLL